MTDLTDRVMRPWLRVPGQPDVQAEDILREQREIAMQGEYLLDSAAAQTGQQFSGLEATFDGATFRHLTATGVGAG